MKCMILLETCHTQITMSVDNLTFFELVFCTSSQRIFQKSCTMPVVFGNQAAYIPAFCHVMSNDVH